MGRDGEAYGEALAEFVQIHGRVGAFGVEDGVGCYACETGCIFSSGTRDLARNLKA